MKLILACVTLLVGCASLLAQAHSSPVEMLLQAGNGTSELQELHNDLKEFAALIPVNQTKLVYVRYALKDREFREAVLYLGSREHRELMHNVSETPAHKELSKYILPSESNATFLMMSDFKSFVGAGSEVDFKVELEEEFGAGVREEFKPKDKDKDKKKKEKGFRGFVKEAKALLALPKIKALRDQKMAAKGQYAVLVAKLRSVQYLSLITNLLADRTVLEYLQVTEDNGVDLLAYSDYVATALGLNLK